MKMLRFAALLLVLGLAAAACGDDVTSTESGGSDGDQAAAAEFEGTTWTYQAFALDDEWREPVEGSTVTFEFADGQLTADTGCNIVNARYVVDGSSISITEVASTLAACENDELADQEQIIVDALQDVGSVQVDENQLQLIHRDNDAVYLAFLRQ